MIYYLRRHRQIELEITRITMEMYVMFRDDIPQSENVLNEQSWSQSRTLWNTITNLL